MDVIECEETVDKARQLLKKRDQLKEEFATTKGSLNVILADLKARGIDTSNIEKEIKRREAKVEQLHDRLKGKVREIKKLMKELEQKDED